MAIPIWAALALVKAAGTGAGVAYSLYQRHKRENEDQQAPDNPPPQPDAVVKKTGAQKTKEARHYHYG